MSASKNIRTIRLYRILQRQCQQLLRASQRSIGRPDGATNDKAPVVFLQPPLDPHAAGRAHMIPCQPSPVVHDNPSVQSHADILSFFCHYYQDPTRKPTASAQQTQPSGTYRRPRSRPSTPADTDEDTDSIKSDTEDDDDDDELIPLDEESHLEIWASSLLSTIGEASNSGPPSIPTLYSTGIWTKVPSLQDTIRQAFRHGTAVSTDHADTTQWAIRAFQLLLEQETMQRYTSIYSYNTATFDGESSQQQITSEADKENGASIRIVATSRCVGRSISKNPNDINRFRFAYRIRIENHQDRKSTDADDDTATVQLLGRTWIIQEYRDEGHTVAGETIRVHAPETGALGQLPGT